MGLGVSQFSVAMVFAAMQPKRTSLVSARLSVVRVPTAEMCDTS